MNDDLFGGQPLTPAQEATLRELQRKANDRIRVYNPIDVDFPVRWDGITFRVPARTRDNGQGQGQAVLPRYVAQLYIKHMTDKILGERMIKSIREENARRRATGQANMNNWEERVVFDGQFRIDNPEARAHIIQILWMGIEEEYGMDIREEENVPRRDTRPIDEQLLEQLDRKKYNGQQTNLPSADQLLQGAPTHGVSGGSTLDAPDPLDMRPAVKPSIPTPPSNDPPLSNDVSDDLLRGLPVGAPGNADAFINEVSQ